MTAPPLPLTAPSFTERVADRFRAKVGQWIDADELLLEHLINNLVGNAAKFEKSSEFGVPRAIRTDVDFFQMGFSFDDYDVGDDEPGHGRPRKQTRGKHRD